MTPSEQDQNQLIIDNLAAIRQAMEGSIAFQARMDEKMTTFDKKLDRVDKAIFGNGKPGIQEQLNSQDKRMQSIENIEKGCKIGEVINVLEDIQERHADEDKAAEECKEAEQKKTDELRKFRYGLISAIVMFVLDVAVRVTGLLK